MTLEHPQFGILRVSCKANMTQNCPVTVEDINIAEKTFGKDAVNLEGKTPRCEPKIVGKDLSEMPKKIHNKHQEFEIACGHD